MLRSIRKIVFPLLLSCMLFLGISAMAEASPAPEDLPQFTWRDYTLGVQSIMINPPHVVDNPSPETDVFVLMRFVTMSGRVPVHEVISDAQWFFLMDADGNEYECGAYMPHEIVFNERNRLFSTAMEQSQFDLFFVVPVTVPIESLSLHLYKEDEVIDTGIVFGDEVVSAVIVDQS